MPADRRLDLPRLGWKVAEDERQIFFLDCSSLKLPGQIFLGLGSFGDDHGSRSIFIEPVNNSGPDLSADGAQIRAVMEQRIDEGAATVTGGRMNDKPRLFIDNDDVAVLVKYVQWNRFGIIFGRLRYRNLPPDPIAQFCTIARLLGSPVNKDFLAGDQGGRQRARTVGKMCGNDRIEPPADVGFFDNNGKVTIHRCVGEVGLIFGTVGNKQRFDFRNDRILVGIFGRRQLPNQ